MTCEKEKQEWVQYLLRSQLGSRSEPQIHSQGTLSLTKPVQALFGVLKESVPDSAYMAATIIAGTCISHEQMFSLIHFCYIDIKYHQCLTGTIHYHQVLNIFSVTSLVGQPTTNKTVGQGSHITDQPAGVQPCLVIRPLIVQVNWWRKQHSSYN